MKRSPRTPIANPMQSARRDRNRCAVAKCDGVTLAFNVGHSLRE
ncbi:hypothetical protein FTUN_3649 [Frigoriglobus tundricola]|uniref:Uncharacterized protein n=1 Tax=Frigoriglobus tundricola TaxID=2774151 RepID=A0A6M5YQ35_9BACT|nr:hypothetical protein FTUN_3649 [Frigoriglobus tundricola]